MTLSKSNPRAKQRWLALGGTVATATLLLVAAVLAVHQLNFQLDGDTSSTDVAPISGVTRTVDWDDLYTNTGAKVSSPPSGFKPGDLTRDFRIKSNGEFDSSDGSTFTTGSKDTLDIDAGWACVGANNVTNKGDITNAYAAEYVVPSGPEAGDKILYFGMEKYVPQGTNNIGIWFLQDQSVGCQENGTGNGNAFSGQHVTGDLLIVSAFSNGGAVSTILAYSWDSTLNGGAGGLVLQTPQAGVDCRQTPASPFDNICGAANTGSISIKWLHASNADGPHGQAGAANIPAATFFEGGINISNFPAFAGKCFTKYLFDTRSAVTTTASIYDYTIGTLGSCSSGTVTTPKHSLNGTTYSNIPAAGVAIPTAASGTTLTVKDEAAITVSGTSTFGGAVKFFLCGPLPLADTTSTCGTGGAQIGTPVGGEPVTGSAGVATVTSDAATLTSVGKYCWRAEYSGDATAGVPASSDSSATECFKVTPVTPTLATQASGTVALTNSISDTATLAGTANKPGTGGLGGAETIAPGSINPTTAGAAAGASITWRALGPGNCTTVAMAATSRTVSGDGNYPTATQTAVSFTPTAVGTYTFVAKYDSDTLNTNSVAESACPDTTGTETVVVTDTSSVTTHQKWLPNDSATVTSAGGSPLSGTLTISLHESADCTGTAVTGQSYSFTLTDAASPATRSTSNATYFVETDKTISWKTTFVSSNPDVQSPAAATCEKSVLDMTPNQP